VLGGLLLIAALLRLPGLDGRAGWDADQGTEMLVLWRLVYQHVIPLVGPPTSIGDLHHGVLYYFLLAPFAWISGDDPVVVAGAIAVAGVAAVGVTWWLARSIGGPTAGLVAGLLMAVSASAISESTGIWNPNLIALSASIALAAAWHAHQGSRARWWVVSAAGLVVTVQCHILGIALAPPLVALYVLDLRRARDAKSRASLGRAGLAAIGVIVLGYLPLIIHELGNGFPEVRSVIAFVTGGGQPVALSLPARLLFVGLRILAWPLAGLVTDHLVVGVVAGSALVAGLAWRSGVAPEPERRGARFLGGTLLFGWLFLGFGVGALTTVTPLPVDHYHAFLDPIVFVGAGLTAAGLWRLAVRGGGGSLPGTLGRGLVGAGVAGLLAFNVAIAPPAQSPDGGWNGADIAAQRVLMATGGRPIELRSLPAFKAPDAYGFPLVWFHAQVSGTTDTPTAWTQAAVASTDGTGATPGAVPAAALASNGAIVTVCDALFIHDCGGAAESAAVPATGFELALRFSAAPGRTISVYLPSP
jgi:4-amino-4-deoxy-L-arabinose transferase-like glycosyltransferase